MFSENSVNNATYGIKLEQTSSSSGGSQWAVLNNIFKNITTLDVYTTVNTNGTSPPSFWNVAGNVIEKGITISDLGGGGANSTNNNRITNNFLAIGAVITGSFGGSVNEIIQGNYQGNTSISSLLNFANDVAAAAGSIPIGGTYRNGSVIQIRVS